MIEYSSDYTDGTLNTGVVPDEVRDVVCRDAAGVTACGVLLAAYNIHTHSATITHINLC